jgi:glucokinase
MESFMTASSLLIGDIGGTNARFAISDPVTPGFTRAMILQCDAYESAELAIEHYLREIDAPRPDALCLAAAGPVVDGMVRITNNHWRLETGKLKRDFHTQAVRLLNDFEAIAYALPCLDPSHLRSIGLPGAAAPGHGDFTLAAIGPGTGLGAVGLCRRNGELFPIVGEAGHTGFAPESPIQMEILAVLRERFARVSNERLVSGPGLENIYWALARLHGEKEAHLGASEICAQGAENPGSRAAETLQLFFEILGQAAGNLALVLGAEQGVFIAGGIARRYPEILISSGFRSAFEAKGRHRSMMERIPTHLITHPEPGLLGASFCALQMQAGLE